MISKHKKCRQPGGESKYSEYGCPSGMAVGYRDLVSFETVEDFIRDIDKVKPDTQIRLRRPSGDCLASEVVGREMEGKTIVSRDADREWKYFDKEEVGYWLRWKLETLYSGRLGCSGKSRKAKKIAKNVCKALERLHGRTGGDILCIQSIFDDLHTPDKDYYLTRIAGKYMANQI